MKTMVATRLTRNVSIVALPSAVLLLCTCRQPTPSTQPVGARVRVYVSIPPQRYFVQRVGGKRVDVSVLLSPGQSPATYEPTPKEMVRLAQAQVYFRAGVPFENQVVDKIGAAMKDLRIVDMREGIDLRAGGDCGGHGEGAERDHRHHRHEHDPHVWMNPRLAKVQTKTICRALCELDAANRDEYETNRRSFEADLDRVDAEIAAALAPLRGREFYVFHPAFGYFADAYGLKQVAIEAGGKKPAAKQLSALIERARKAGVRLLFVQPQFDKSTAQAVATEIGGAVVPLDPLAEDYLDNLRRVASTINTALTSTRPSGAE